MAGVLLVEKYRNNFGRIDYAVILFYNIYKDTYEDPGGHLTERKTIQESAAKELIEESCNLFRINPLYLTNHIYYNGYYSFLLYVQGPTDLYGGNPIYSEYYHHNRNFIHYQNAPAEYKETDNMRRFYISDLINCGLLFNKGELICTDANGHIRRISGRTKGILRSFIAHGYIGIINNRIAINFPPLTLGFNPNYQSYKKPFLNGTRSYFI